MRVIALKWACSEDGLIPAAPAISSMRSLPSTSIFTAKSLPSGASSAPESLILKFTADHAAVAPEALTALLLFAFEPAE